jgi:hypothetical protein
MSEQNTTSDRTDQQTTPLTQKDYVDPRNCYESESNRRCMQEKQNLNPDYKTSDQIEINQGFTKVAAIKDEHGNIAIGIRRTDADILVDGERLLSPYKVRNAGEIELTDVGRHKDPDDPMKDAEDWFEHEPQIVKEYVLSRLFGDGPRKGGKWHIEEMSSTYVSFWHKDVFGHFTVYFELGD